MDYLSPAAIMLQIKDAKDMLSLEGGGGVQCSLLLHTAVASLSVLSLSPPNFLNLCQSCDSLLTLFFLLHGDVSRGDATGVSGHMSGLSDVNAVLLSVPMTPSVHLFMGSSS